MLWWAYGAAIAPPPTQPYGVVLRAYYYCCTSYGLLPVGVRSIASLMTFSVASAVCLSVCATRGCL